ncbi:MAG: hypothetical protein JWQ35_789 [Bacteriovoracaceae bacterium]|nr:hypothetical protein [Bacteriovoracaceae bacterium]
MRQNQSSGSEGAAILTSAFLERKARNPRYSLRAMALSLKIPPGRLSEYFSQKRRVTPKVAIQIAERLQLDPVKRNRLLKSAQFHSESEIDSIDENYLTLSLDQFNSISDPIHFAILSLSETENSKSDPLWIAKRLKISVSEVRGALERLERLELIYVKNGKLFPLDKQLATTTDISSPAIRLSHQKTLERAASALEDISVEWRDFSCMVVAADLKKIPEAKKMIRHFRRRLAKFLKSEKPTEVYSLSIQLLPMTQLETKEKYEKF